MLQRKTMQNQPLETQRKTELLAPAGNMEAFRGALNAGADAVYLAGRQFGARAYAGNFTEEELQDALQRAHLFGVRIYLTVNTLTRQEELADLTAFVCRMYEAGLDGVIVQDLGVAACIRKACPGLELHASTQMSVTGAEAVRFLKRQGFVRVVPARELSLSEIKALKKEGLEIESFIHGAMCYSYSGKCLLSSFLGGRSGNRGRCAGPCRLPYEALEEGGIALGKGEMCYPLSMKDMCALPILPKLMDAGIDSFKIEGRMKKPEYVAGTTAIYRKYIDRFYEWDAKGRPGVWSIDREDLDALNQLYIRSDLCTGYYERRNGKELVTMHEPGYRGADPALLAKIRSQYLEKEKKASVQARAVIKAGREAELELFAKESGVCVSVKGALVQEAKKRALTREDIAGKLGKTGNLPLEFQSLLIETDGRSFLPVSALGELRRRAAEAFLQSACAPGGETTAPGITAAARLADSAESVVPCRAVASMESAEVAASGDSVEFVKEHLSVHQGCLARFLIQVQTLPQAKTAIRWISRMGKTRQAQAKRQVEPTSGLPGRVEKKTYALILDGQALDAAEAVRREIAALEENMDCRIPVLAALPYVFRESDRAWLEAFYKENSDKFYGFVTRSLEELEFLKEKEYDRAVLADSFLYTWNANSLRVLRENGPKAGSFFRMLPVELDRQELQRTFADDLEDAALLVYGRVPLMLSAGCIRKTKKNCLLGSGSGNKGMDQALFLRDRTGAMFPVRTDCRHCQNILYNSVPNSLHKSLGDALMQQCGSLLLSFTMEKPEEMGEILALFAGDTKAQAPAAYTTGHYRKGAL